MENNEIARYLAALEREDCYRVEATLKESPHELTQRVFFVGANGAEQGPYVRKFIHRESGMGAAYERIHEAQRGGKRFKHIPLIHECYRHDSFLVVIMEFVAGETLQDLVYRRDPSEQLALDVFPRVCDAVTELHEAFDPPLIHRDLKPSNVMLAGDALTIIDFGIAREFRQDAETDTTQFGTRAFAPPEQFGFGQTTVRSDVYALGMMLYFCLTEKIPTAQVRDARFEVGNVPPHLRPVLARATDLDPSERFASAAELKAAFLEAVAQGEPEAAPRSEPGSRPRKGRVTAAAIGAACIVAALVAIVVLHPANVADSSEAANQGQGQDRSTETSSQATGNETAEQEAVADMQTDAPARDGFDPATNLTTTIAGVTFQIPGYFGARINENDDSATFYYAESGSSLAMIMAGETTMTSNDGAATDVDDVEAAKDSYLNGLIGSAGSLETVTSSTDCSLAGQSARIVTFTGAEKGLAVKTKAVYFIDGDTGAIGSLFFGQTDNAQFDYSADFAKTIASATPAN